MGAKQLVTLSKEADAIKIEMDCNGEFLGKATTGLLLSVYRENPELLSTILMSLTEAIEEEEMVLKDMHSKVEEVLKNGF